MIVLAGVWLRPRESFTDTEAELISQRSEAVRRYLERLFSVVYDLLRLLIETLTFCVVNPGLTAQAQHQHLGAKLCVTATADNQDLDEETEQVVEEAVEHDPGEYHRPDPAQRWPPEPLTHTTRRTQFRTD